jgi:hypothetical protein
MPFERHDHWSAAMLHMRLALELLDSSDAPALIGARLDQAIDALQKELNRLPPRLRTSQKGAEGR